MKTHANRSVAVVIYAKDCRALARFYASVFGLTVEKESPRFVVLGLDALELDLVQAPPPISNAMSVASPPEPRSGTPIKISLLVSEIEAVRAPISASGGHLKPAETTWSWNGALHLDGWDPEGNVFQLRQAGSSGSSMSP